VRPPYPPVSGIYVKYKRKNWRDGNKDIRFYLENISENVPLEEEANDCSQANH